MKITKPTATSLNKDGYKTGGVDISVPSRNLEMDPRGLSSFRGRGVYVATGDKVTVKGTKTRKPVKATWF